MNGENHLNFFNGTRAALLVCLSLFVAACGRGGVSPGAKTAGANPREELAKAMGAHINTKSYRAKSSVSTSAGVTTKMELEFVAPDRFRVVMETNMSGRDGGKREMIILGKETYMKEPDGQWKKVATDLSAQISQFRDPKMIEMVTKDADVKFVGEEAHEGSPAHVYQHTFTKASQQGITGVTKTWVGVADGLPLKTETDGETNYQGQPMTVKTTTSYYDYNTGIKIDSPL